MLQPQRQAIAVSPCGKMVIPCSQHDPSFTVVPQHNIWFAQMVCRCPIEASCYFLPSRHKKKKKKSNNDKRR
jgi:hypothetical protein